MDSSATVTPRPASCRFGPLDVTFDRRVLTPRPWTLAQSAWAAELAHAAPPGPILELCAGAGQIGLAAAVLADRPLVAVDADPVAVTFARANAVPVRQHVEVRHARIDEALRPAERFPIILADPPYLPSAEVAEWPDDPLEAIDGGEDGLDLIRACLVLAAAHLSPGGRVLLQVAGPAQADRAGVVATATDLSTTALRVTDERRAILCLEHR